MDELMTERERKSRKLCEHHGVDPDKFGQPVGENSLGCQVNDGKEYKLWEYWAMHFVDILEEK